uniref:NADH-ubiquinone oxidoreductase chain 5 n=1 Tax=Bolivaritettix yuanbaoshanensis TaxID=2035527 RepID=A0A343K036_9ORTH|nr:NADH dehydrogenase subunit 5 [Bolivaritettix yuanbaoshanensis]
MLNIFYVFCLLLFISGFISFFMGLYMLLFDFSCMIEWEIYSMNSSVVLMAFILDWMSLIFMGFVLMISFTVLFYSNDYMMGDLTKSRFVLLVMMFVLSMLFLIISPNLISILLGWDGLGLVSYCLVIYYQNIKSFSAGMLTALTNRVGDVFILMSISWMLNFGSWNYIYYYDYFYYSYDYTLICYLVMLAAMTKSAQIPFSAWLPAAMSAPTPVSALVHSSTLVTAGVYLLIRFSPLMILNCNYYMLFIGCLTMLMSGLVANYEFDLKKIIALSTLSQLGLMMGILSLGFPTLSFFHLLIHALFKALLFLCAGCYIHSLLDQQDIRYMGSLVKLMPYSSVCFNVANLSLCGFPFLSGFYSSDLILEVCSLDELNIIIYLMFYISTGLTAMYSIRLFYYSLINNFNFNVLRDFNNSGSSMNLGMLILLMLVILGGSIMSWLLFPTPSCIYLPLSLKLLTLMVVLIGLYLGYFINLLNFDVYNNIYYVNIKYFMGYMWFMPFLSTKFMSISFLRGGGVYSCVMDYGWLEYYGAGGIYGFMKYFIEGYLYLFDYNFKSYVMLFFSLIIVYIFLSF